jgi:hypothetical protein
LRPGPVERPLEVAFGAPEFGLEEPVDGEEDDAVKALHLKKKKTDRFTAVDEIVYCYETIQLNLSWLGPLAPSTKNIRLG